MSLLRLTLLCLAFAFGGAVPARAADLPLLWDTKERLPRPDLTEVARVRFLTTTDFRPFNFLDAGGRLTGFHIDLARAICVKLGISDRCQVQALPWNELNGALARGDGEAIIAGTAITAQSRRAYAFSRPYMMLPARFVVPRASRVQEPVYDAVQDQRIGVLAGSTHERMLRDYFGAVKPVTYSRADWMYEDLRAGKLAGIFGDGMRLSFWLGSTEAGGCCNFAGGPYLSADHLGHGLAIAVKPSDAVLAQAFDYALQAIAVDGTLGELYLRYFPIGFF